MPRLIKYNTNGIIDDIPDSALQVIEHTTLHYMVDKRFNGVNKYIVFATLGSLYELYISKIKTKN